MRLYIPTSSLNADNILACEFITPPTLCKDPRFGYQNFEQIDILRKFATYTLAFSAIPSFYIKDIDQPYNFPMVVEIEVDNIEDAGFKLINEIDGVMLYATATPIPVHPGMLHLLFFDPMALKQTFINCESSARCKLFDYFCRGGFDVISKSAIKKPLDYYIHGISIPSIACEFSENAYDRTKGFIWGFAMGFLRSVQNDTAQLIRIRQRIYDIISASKSDGFISEQLLKEIENLDKEYSRYDPIRREAQSLWRNELALFTDMPVDEVDALLKHFGVENSAKYNFLKEKGITLRRSFVNYATKCDYSEYISDMTNHCRALVAKTRREMLVELPSDQSLDVDTEKFETVMLSDDDTSSTLFNRLLNRIMWNCIISSPDALRINRSEEAIKVVKTLKAVFESLNAEWIGTNTQAYFDRMRRNISMGEAFDLSAEHNNMFNNDIFKSVAAFVLKGDDFENLTSYLEMNAITDYRLVYALWGALTGYASISRSIIKEFNCSEIEEIYTYAQKLLHKVKRTLPNGEMHKDPALQDSEETFMNKVLNVFEELRSKSRWKNQDSLRQGLVRALEEFEDAPDVTKFVSRLKDFDSFGWKSKNQPWQKMRDALSLDLNRNSDHALSVQFQVHTQQTRRNFLANHGTQTELSDLFSPEHPSSQMGVQLGKSFINDDTVEEIINNIQGLDVSVRLRVIENLRYIQKNYSPGGKYLNAGKSLQNSDVIRHFINLCISKKTHSQCFEKKSPILDELKRILEAHYPNGLQS